MKLPWNPFWSSKRLTFDASRQLLKKALETYATASYSSAVCDYITNERKKCQILRFPVRRGPIHTSWNNIFCGSPSEVLYFPYFSLCSCKFPPTLKSNKISLYQEKSCYHFSPQSYINHKPDHSSWQLFTKLQSTSLEAEQTIWCTTKGKEVPFIPGSWHKCQPWCPSGLSKQFNAFFLCIYACIYNACIYSTSLTNK